MFYMLSGDISLVHKHKSGGFEKQIRVGFEIHLLPEFEIVQIRRGCHEGIGQIGQGGKSQMSHSICLCHKSQIQLVFYKSGSVF